MLFNGRALQMPLSRAWLKAPLLGGVSEGRGGFNYRFALTQNGTKKIKAACNISASFRFISASSMHRNASQ